jgi:hypothetical protein
MGTGIPARSSGDQTVNYLRAPFDFSLGYTGVKKIGFIPAGSVVLRAYCIVTTGFNAGSTNTCTIGTPASAASFGTGIALGTAGVISSGTALATSTAATPAADTEVDLTMASTGTAASAGAGIVVVEYLPVA